jgi:hypothetical protein
VAGFRQNTVNSSRREGRHTQEQGRRPRRSERATRGVGYITQLPRIHPARRQRRGLARSFGEGAPLWQHAPTPAPPAPDSHAG